MSSAEVRTAPAHLIRTQPSGKKSQFLFPLFSRTLHAKKSFPRSVRLIFSLLSSLTPYLSRAHSHSSSPTPFLPPPRHHPQRLPPQPPPQRLTSCRHLVFFSLSPFTFFHPFLPPLPPLLLTTFFLSATARAFLSFLGVF